MALTRIYTPQNIREADARYVGGSRFAPRALGAMGGMGGMGNAAGDFVHNLVGGIQGAVKGKADEIQTKLDRVELALKISMGASVLTALVVLLMGRRK